MRLQQTLLYSIEQGRNQVPRTKLNQFFIIRKQVHTRFRNPKKVELEDAGTFKQLKTKVEDLFEYGVTKLFK